MAASDGSNHYLVRLSPYRNADRQTDDVVIAFVDITSLVKGEERQQVLVSELQHRTRDLLAVIQSIARQTLAPDPSLDTFINGLGTLGRLQGLVGEAHRGLVDLGDIVTLELNALGVADSGRVTVSGPAVPLGFRNVQTFALVLHELATNALKYGALKDDAARLDVCWQIVTGDDQADSLVFDWRESGLTTVPDASRTGFGRQLIEKALKFSLHAKTELTFNPDGVSCHIEIPLPVVQEQEARARTKQHD